MAVVSRRLEDLHGDIRPRAEEFLAMAKKNGVDVLVTCTFRDRAAQEALYACGRTAPGKKLTCARPGESMHNFEAFDGGLMRPASRAFDVVPIVNGKPSWDVSGEGLKLWKSIGRMGEDCGLEWAGNWSGQIREMAHFQLRSK